MLEDLFRNRLSLLQPVFPQAAWQGAAGAVSGMAAAGRVKPPPRDLWPGPGRQQACRQARLFVPRLLGAQTALPHGSTVPGAQSLCGAQPLPQTPAHYSRTAQAGAAATPSVRRPLLWGGGSPRGKEGARNEAPSTSKARARSQQMATAPCCVFTELLEVGAGKLLSDRSCSGGIQQHRYRKRWDLRQPRGP